jgi:hypothetical protein
MSEPEHEALLKQLHNIQFIMRYAEVKKSVAEPIKTPLFKLTTLNSERSEFEPFYKVISKFRFEE